MIIKSGIHAGVDHIQRDSGSLEDAAHRYRRGPAAPATAAAVQKLVRDTTSQMAEEAWAVQLHQLKERLEDLVEALPDTSVEPAALDAE